ADDLGVDAQLARSEDEANLVDIGERLQGGHQLGSRNGGRAGVGIDPEEGLVSGELGRDGTQLGVTLVEPDDQGLVTQPDRDLGLIVELRPNAGEAGASHQGPEAVAVTLAGYEVAYGQPEAISGHQPQRRVAGL